MIIETVRVSQKAKDQLIQLKRTTGIQNWNVLCRWALCVSLADPTPIKKEKIKTDSSIEMDWQTFTGKNDETYNTLILHPAHQHRFGPSTFLINHIHRGITLLSALIKQDCNLAKLLIMEISEK